jgi:orotate phosphoribosyltransferase
MIEADIHKSDDTRRSREKVRSAVTARPMRSTCPPGARPGVPQERAARPGGEVGWLFAGAGSPGDYDVVEAEVIRLAHPRRGHFDLGTGYHGDVWLDLDALFLRPAMLRPHVRWLSDRLSEHRIDAVCGPVEGGAFLAQAIADLMGSSFLAAYRCAAPRPGEVTAYRLPCVRGGIGGWRVAIVDDAVNAGTAVRACYHQVRKSGAIPVAVAALLSLGRASAMVAATMSVPFYTVGTIPGQTWPAEKCPLCADGTPIAEPLVGS